ncbi:MAG: ATP-binding protein [Rhodocyclaceae bacterium]|nr:ATP-binding protein [Rhodocyclaceae bacterium]
MTGSQAAFGLLLLVLLLGGGLALHRLRSRGEAARMSAELEQLRATAALHTSEARFRAIVDSILEAIFIHDIDTGAILSSNRRAQELYGMSEEVLQAARVQDLSEGVFPYTQAEAALWMMKAAAGEPQTFEWHARDGSGRLFWVEVTLRRARIDERDCLLAVEHDITHRKAQDEELRQNLDRQVQLNQKLEEAHNQLLQSEKMASIGQLAAGVAHELNNPIGFVHSNLGSLDKYIQDIFEITAAYEKVEKTAGCNCTALDHVRQLKRDKDYEFLREDIFQLMTESKDGLVRVRKIVQDLKDFSHVGDMNWHWTNLHQGIDSTLNIVWNELKYKCKVVKEYGDLPEVYCLPSQLNQVFMNLLVNAGHAIEEKGRITLRTGREGDEVWISVSDTGKGITRENLTRIFDPFFTTKPVGKGTGLGLSLSYGIIQKHQGRIEVESEVGVGTTFKVTIPVRPSSAPEEGKTT